MKKPDPSRLTLQTENKALRERLKTAEQTIRDLRSNAGAPEEELQLTRELLESVTEGTGAIIATIDTDYRYTYFNRTHHEELKRLTGKDTTLGMSLTDALADFPAERDAALALWTRALSGETVSQTIELGDPGRYRRYYATRHTPIRDAHGAILGAGEVTFDITGQIAAEKALRESELETASVAKFPAENPNPILRVSPSGVLLYANEAAAELLALHACAVGAPVPDAWRSSLAAPIAQWRRGQFEVEWRERRYSFDVVPIREADYINLYGRDVTELRQSETRYRMLAENSPDLITRLDKDLRFTYANTRLLSLAGVKAGDLVGRLVGVLKLPEGVLTFLTEVRARALETPDTRETEFELPLAGSRRIFNIRVVPEHTPDGELESFLLIGRDITGFRESRRELERTRDYLNKLLNYANAPVIVWDPQSRITMFNHAFERLTGYAAAEVLGRELTLLFPEESRAASLEKIEQTLAGEYLETVEIPIRQKSGLVRTVLWNSANICAEDGTTLTAIIAQGQDITERKEAEQVIRRDRETLERLIAERTDELMTARMELEMSRRLSDIGTLAATVAHELRNPLAAITVAAANIQRKAKNPLLESHLVNIKKKVNESDQIINNLLFFSRIKAPRYQVTELHQLIDECLETAGLHARDRITVNKKFDAVRGVAIEADPVQLQEVFTNLMNNARDALGERGGNIDIHASREPDRITIKIADDGMGIDEKDLERVFEPFFTTKARGTGLGLAVCRQIIALHGGTISIDSTVGKGTAVVVSLPQKA